MTTAHVLKMTQNDHNDDEYDDDHDDDDHDDGDDDARDVHDADDHDEYVECAKTNAGNSLLYSRVKQPPDHQAQATQRCIKNESHT